MNSKKAFLFYITFFVLMGIIQIAHAGINPQIEFIEHQAIVSNGATDWEFFEFDGNQFLALANEYNGSSYTTNSKIYQWDGIQFNVIQEITTQGAVDWEYFMIGSNHFLAVANSRTNSSWSINSTIYQWNGTSFVPFQSIPSSGGWNWEYFTIDSDHFLALANNRNASSGNVDSQIYRWDGSGFVVHQTILTYSAADWNYFSINNEHYLAVANHAKTVNNSPNYNTNSVIYRWDGNEFMLFQEIATNGAYDWEHFMIGSDHFLAMANSYDGSTWLVDSKIYRWSVAENNFVDFQSILTKGAAEWRHYVIGNNHFLALANRRDSLIITTLDSQLYWWEETEFVAYQPIPTNTATDWEFFILNNESYLAVSEAFDGASYNIHSKIYRANHLNQPPIADAGGPYYGNEGEGIALSNAIASDSDGDNLTYNWTVDSILCSYSDPTVLNPTLTCDDNGDFTTTFTVSDGINEPVSGTATVSVNNVAPIIGAIIAPVDPVEVDITVNVSAIFTDPSLQDTHTAEWDWDDNSTSPGTVSDGTVTGSHAYSEPGVYTVTLTVTDDDGGVGTAIFEFIVIYDPDGGFVTGGGWFDSPAGAYVDDPLLAGTANFGFVSKYKKNASIPTGQTEFQFQVAELNFHSDSYDWLVVNQGGANAQYKGSGTINGGSAPNGELFKFMIWATDNDPDGGDTFHIKIWWEDNGNENLVYDNGAEQAISGGNIKVHKAK